MKSNRTSLNQHLQRCIKKMGKFAHITQHIGRVTSRGGPSGGAGGRSASWRRAGRWWRSSPGAAATGRAAAAHWTWSGSASPCATQEGVGTLPAPSQESLHTPEAMIFGLLKKMPVGKFSKGVCANVSGFLAHFWAGGQAGRRQVSFQKKKWVGFGRV